MKKHKKLKFRYIIVMNIVFIYVLMMVTHIISFPIFAYKAYFKIHKSDFESIADYVNNKNQTIYCYKDFNGEVHKSSITDSKTEKSVRKIYSSIMFEDINGGVDDSDNEYYGGTKVHFDIDFFISFNGEPYELCYSTEKPNNIYTRSRKDLAF